MEKEDFKKALRKAIQNFRVENKSTWTAVEKLGFSVVRGRKHYKLVFKGHRTHTFPVSVTPSDNRAALNMVSIIINNLEGEL